MPTLQDYRKLKYKSVQSFADAAHITRHEATYWLRASREDLNPEPLYALLGLTKDTYEDAYDATKEDEDAKWKAKHPPLSPEQQAIKDAEFKAYCDERYAKMTPAEKRRLHEQCVELGLVQERRSPLDVMIDRACGLE